MRRTAQLCCVLAWLIAAAPASAQLSLTWSSVDLGEEVPATIQVFEATSDDPPVAAWYVRADLSDTTWTVQGHLSDDGDGLETVTSFARDAGAYVAINGGYFGSGTSYSFVAEGGEVLAPNLGALGRGGQTFYPTRSAIGVLADGRADVAWIYDVGGTTYGYPSPSPNRQGTPQPIPTASFPSGGAPWPVEGGIGGGPVLVENGQARITWEEEVFFGSGIGGVDERNPRTAAGYTAEGELLLLVVDGRQASSQGASLAELAELMIELGAVEAVNLDGGGSTAIAAGGRLLNSPSDGRERPVASALVLAPPQKAGGDEPNTILFDTGDACCYRERGGTWFESSNTPFHGGTPARLVEAGSGEASATFVLDGIAAGRYAVEAWWVPAFNRATNTPFIIYSGGAGTTVRVDQSDATTLGQWNTLGTFDLAPGDSIVVTNEATGAAATNYVCVDGMRLVDAAPTKAEGTAWPRRGPELTLYPNPSDGRVTIRVTSMRAGAVRGAIYDLLGRVVVRFEERMGGRAVERTLVLPAVAPGLYIVRVETPAGWLDRPLIVAY